MDHFPIFLDVRGKDVLLCGGGLLAVQRTEQILRAGARVTVVAPALSAELAGLVAAGRIRHATGDLASLEGSPPVLAFGAAEDAESNRRMHAWAVEHHIPVNVQDQAELCTFIMPAIVDRSPVLVAISTGGHSPTLARLLRERLEALVPQALGELARIAGTLRGEVKRRLPDFAARRAFWDAALPRAEPAAYANDEAQVRFALQSALDEAAGGVKSQGEVWLVGAGPGDPELLTLKALRVLQQAEVVLHDRLVAEEILALIPPQAERIYAGKMAGGHHVEQAWTEAQLIEKARQGKRVVRLKGGDPFIFGRGGEELEALRAAGITAHVVPGITAATGCAAAAGIPLTHRNHANQVLFVTAHRCAADSAPDWEAMARPGQTLAVYMGLLGLDSLLEGLVDHGMSRDMPAALVAHGTTPRQEVVRGTIGTLGARVKEAIVTSPALLIVGEVAAEQPGPLRQMAHEPGAVSDSGIPIGPLH